MPPRIPLYPHRAATTFIRRLYSTETEPLIRVTNIPSQSSGHIRVLELNRPKARNAISKALLAALRAEVDDLHAQYGPNGEETGVSADLGPTRALVLASAVDTCFCAGADLKERKGFTPEE
jgi:methylglutaconyl-CoA hydratase